MKKVYVTEENKELIGKMCQKVHKGCSTHIMDNEDVEFAARGYKEALSNYLKKHHRYINYIFSLSASKSNSYKYSYQADEVILSSDKKGIYIKTLRRKNFCCNSQQNNGIILECKNEEKESILSEIKEHLFKQFFVKTW